MTLSVLTPNRIFFEGEINEIALDGHEGRMVIKPRHTSFIFALKEGIVTINTPEGKQYAAVMGGFAEVHEDRVVLLTEAAEWPEEIDEHRATCAKERAMERIKEKEEAHMLDRQRALKSLARSEVRLKLMIHRTKK
ncbi:MAG: ATP synthase F1 subunit epsilon [Defluviitaleaceae bacterium]|nr:ATP synthase F1 subunit epsilon [Defluviitaleaceae bacterium]